MNRVNSRTQERFAEFCWLLSALYFQYSSLFGWNNGQFNPALFQLRACCYETDSFQSRVIFGAARRRNGSSSLGRIHYFALSACLQSRSRFEKSPENLPVLP